MISISIQFFGGRGSGSGKSNYQPANSSTQSEHMSRVAELNSSKYEDGTYDLNTMTPISYDSGYQVTFSQIGDDYTAEEYADKVNEFLKASSDGKTLAGKFEGTPEVSFHVNSRSEAIALAKKYNQISVWDWGNCDEIKTGGTGERRK